MSVDATPFSVLIRDASRQQHIEAESSPFMSEMLGGELDMAAFTRYTEQLWFIYQALEGAADWLADDPVAGPFIRPELARSAALRQDLDHLHGGDDWQATLRPLPATATYADRITEVSRSWPGGYVAHHYTRYLGDLSGGQIIRDTAEKNWGLERKGAGVRFYVFDGIANPAAFKRDYRAALDAIAADTNEKQNIVRECKRAFTLNSAVFQDLGAHAS